MSRRNTGQSIVEYAILLGVIIAVLLIMQVFVKRGYQGGLKDAADKMGDQFSASSTTIKQTREMLTDQNIVEGVGTDSTINNFAESAGLTSAPTDVVSQGVYSFNQRTGGESKATLESKTASASQEKTRRSEYQTDTVEDFASPLSAE
ncbi:MAG: hypothetical protein M0Q96_00705 [Candidatus Omnitrophica bacterium]|jgi:uncharacterized protein (UPF0333 family)|nr:hypothetical protein [Candidatus Omnitrophota bacterium]